MTVFQTPVTLMSIVSAKIWGVVSSQVAGMQMPAFATTTSSRPNAATPRARNTFMPSRSRTSPCVGQDATTDRLDLLGRLREVVGGGRVVRDAGQRAGEVEGEDVGPLAGEPDGVRTPLPRVPHR